MNSPHSTRPGRELEYNTLRAEILKRMELRQQLMANALTFAGVLLGVAITDPSKNIVALIYPPLAFSLAALWAQNDIRSREIGKYIYKLEKNNPPSGLGWETYYRQKLRSPTFIWARLSVLAPGSVFLLSEIIAFTIAFSSCSSLTSNCTANFPPIALLLLSSLSIIGTALLICMVTRTSVETRRVK
jgi:hypothetical protein